MKSYSSYDFCYTLWRHLFQKRAKEQDFIGKELVIFETLGNTSDIEFKSETHSGIITSFEWTQDGSFIFYILNSQGENLKHLIRTYSDFRFHLEGITT